MELLKTTKNVRVPLGTLETSQVMTCEFFLIIRYHKTKCRFSHYPYP